MLDFLCLFVFLFFFPQVVRNLQAAADGGCARARFNLAILHEKGRRGVEVDLKEARRLYRLCAKQGEARAHFNLALMYACVY